ncbi:hypothetical protein X566_22710 [Afipia sp. P52-10]|nr:hypothetical protein X566_22710 [Afipia sp. P52-10]
MQLIYTAACLFNLVIASGCQSSAEKEARGFREPSASS